MDKFISILVILMLLPGFLGAEHVRFRLPDEIDTDETGKDLRRAITAYETAMERPVPESWTRVTLTRNEPLHLGTGNFLILQAPEEGRQNVLFVDDQGPHEVILEAGQETEAGSLALIPVSVKPGDREAELLIRARERLPLLMDSAPGDLSKTKITGYDDPPEIVVDTPNQHIADFSREFLKHYVRETPAEQAARLARKQVPPPSDLSLAAAPPVENRYRDPTNVLDEPEGSHLPQAAVVTLYLVRGEASSLQALESEIAYTNRGRDPDEPQVRARGGGRGGEVEIGRRGDRFQARLRALESSGKAQTESETFLRVPLGGRSRLSLYGPNGLMEAWIRARPRGQSAVELDIDQESGNWGFLGSVSTRVRVRDGQTVTLAKNSYKRESSASSGVPILSGIPYIGPVFGREVSRSESFTYALYATVELE